VGKRVLCAVDMGIVVHADTVQAQAESGTPPLPGSRSRVKATGPPRINDRSPP